MVVLVVLSAALAIDTPSASACSCVPLVPAEMLELRDGAFIGSLVAKAEPQGEGNGLFDSGEEVAYTFEVTEWIKGDLSPGLVDVFSPVSGASCGFETPVGAEVAVYLFLEGGRLSGDLCGTGSASDLRATVAQASLDIPLPAPAIEELVLAPPQSEPDATAPPSTEPAESATSTAEPEASAPLTAEPEGDASSAGPGTSNDAAGERTWLGWLSGFVAVGVVLGMAAVAAAVIRRRRTSA